MNKKLFVFYITIICFIGSVYSQEYKYEIGGSVGASSYIGDANRTNPFLHAKPSLSVIHRYNVNLNWALKSNVVLGKVAGDTRDSKNVFPNGNEAAFSRSFYEIGSQVEYNFLPYSDKFSYMNSRRYSPYLFTGIGITIANGNSFFMNASLPIGVGIKYKLKERVNIGSEFSIRKLFGDNFDVVDKSDYWDLDSPFGIKSSLYKNKDWYMFVSFFFTWDFGVKYNPCCGGN